MLRLPNKKVKELLFCAFIISTLIYFGVFTHIFESDFYKDFHYPYDGDIEEFVQQLRQNITPKVKPINSYTYHYSMNCAKKCKDVDSIRLVYLIKSDPEHFDRRIAIRSSWGFERRFSDVEIRTVFLVGERDNWKIQKMLEEESQKFGDIIQGNFRDNYFNNTLKTMMGFHWAVTFCSHSKFYMFVDDDYYVSTKNVLRFVRNPTNYPKYLQPMNTINLDLLFKKRNLKQFDFDLDENVRLYSGYAFRSSPHRHYSSKWYVSLEEYPYHMWPPYVTAGAIILSRESLLDMYYASFYTKHFRFDDIYVGLLAFKTKIEPFHSNYFYFHKLSYNPKLYTFVIASHGYEDPTKLVTVWTQQKSLGNA